jgi:hypothetical protein
MPSTGTQYRDEANSMRADLEVLRVLVLGITVLGADAFLRPQPAQAAPAVASTDPENADEVPASTGITITFSEEVVLAGDAQGDWFTFTCSMTSEEDLNATVGINSATVRTVAHDGLTPGEECTFTILAAAVEDVNGDNMLADYAFTFTVEYFPPTVLSTDPENDDEVPVSTGISIVFSEPVTTITDEDGDWFVLECTVSVDLDPVGGSGDGGTTWQVGHNGFTPGEECTFTILADRVFDQDGTFMESNYVFSFTVEDVPIACPPEPRSGCFLADGAQLQLKLNANPARSQLAWKWQRGDAFAQMDLGEPATTTHYYLCIYDQAASVAELVEDLLIDPSTAWTSKDPKGLIYKDKPGGEDGVQQVKIKTGAATKTQAQLKAKGTNLTMPIPVGGGVYFDQDPSVVVQLANSVNACWTSEFTSSTKNSDTEYKAKAP